MNEKARQDQLIETIKALVSKYGRKAEFGNELVVWGTGTGNADVFYVRNGGTVSHHTLTSGGVTMGRKYLDAPLFDHELDRLQERVVACSLYLASKAFAEKQAGSIRTLKAIQKALS